MSILEQDFTSILNPEENSISSADLVTGMASHFAQEKKIGTCYLIRENLGDTGRIIGVVNAFEEYSDWRGGQVAWVYDFKILTSILQVEIPENVLRSILVTVIIELLKNVKSRGFRNLRWLVYENDAAEFEQ